MNLQTIKKTELKETTGIKALRLIFKVGTEKTRERRCVAFDRWKNGQQGEEENVRITYVSMETNRIIRTSRDRSP